MYLAGFVTATEASEQAQNHVYRSATGINPCDSFRIFPKIFLNHWLFVVT
jgi:hypothetical protein